MVKDLGRASGNWDAAGTYRAPFLVESSLVGATVRTCAAENTKGSLEAMFY